MSYTDAKGLLYVNITFVYSANLLSFIKVTDRDREKREHFVSRRVHVHTIQERVASRYE